MRHADKHNRCKGFTLIELITVIAMAGILTLGIGVLLANGQKSWGTLKERVYGDAAVESFAAQQAFDTVCRKATLRKHVLSDSGDFLELYYWDVNSSASTPENYGRFYKSGSNLFAEYGKLQNHTWQPDTDITPRTLQIARDIESLRFTVEGTSVQMYLNYTDPKMMPMVCSSVRHNE